MTVTAIVTTKNQCKFNTKNATLDFGSLDNFNSVDVSVQADLFFVCIGMADPVVFGVSHDDGLYESGPGAPRMEHSTLPGNFIPYELNLSTVGGTAPKKVEQTLTVTGTVRGADYQSALGGIYGDTVTLTIVP